MKNEEFDRKSGLAEEAVDAAGTTPRAAVAAEAAPAAGASMPASAAGEPELIETGITAGRSAALTGAAAAEPAENETELAPGPMAAEKTESRENEDDVEEEEEADEEPEEQVKPAEEGEELGFTDDDPLAPAYDLERGTLLDQQQSAAASWRSEVRTAKEFFNSELLYRFDILEMEERDLITGKYRIELKGYQGGVWTISIGNDMEVVNRKEDADLVLTMQQRDFLLMVNGRLNPQLAILGNKIKLQGDVKRAVWFQTLLYPSVD